MRGFTSCVSSPGQLFMLIIQYNNVRIEISNECFILILKLDSLSRFISRSPRSKQGRMTIDDSKTSTSLSHHVASSSLSHHVASSPRSHHVAASHANRPALCPTCFGRLAVKIYIYSLIILILFMDSLIRENRLFHLLPINRFFVLTTSCSG